jgi:hydroxymethylbilane synthase
MNPALRVGTRGSPLALAQTEEVLGRLRAIRPDLRTDTVVIRTHGDEGYREDLGTALDGKRAFTKRIEEALLDGRIDFAVHSLKDLPTEAVDGVVIGAIPPREDPRDVLVGRGAINPSKLGPGVRVGTSSLRRRAQLLSHWPGLEVKELHGNVGTRLSRLDANDFDAVVVAAAGLRRLHVEDRRTHALPPNIMTPAPGQGALALEARAADRPILDLLSAIDDPRTRRTTEAERALSARFGVGCNVPFGALATLDRGITLHAVIADSDGHRIVRCEDRGDESRWHDVVDSVWRKLVREGGDTLIAEAA